MQTKLTKQMIKALKNYNNTIESAFATQVN